MLPNESMRCVWRCSAQVREEHGINGLGARFIQEEHGGAVARERVLGPCVRDNHPWRLASGTLNGGVAGARATATPQRRTPADSRPQRGMPYGWHPWGVDTCGHVPKCVRVAFVMVMPPRLSRRRLVARFNREPIEAPRTFSVVTAGCLRGGKALARQILGTAECGNGTANDLFLAARAHR